MGNKLKNLFFTVGGITHTTGVPHSPTGQLILGRAHGSLKRILEQQKGRVEIETLPTVKGSVKLHMFLIF